jgi:hypothetical protein
MPKVKIEAGATFETISQAEMREVLADWLDEVRRGVRYVRRAMAGVVDGTGALALGSGISAVGDDMGPDGSFLWAVNRIAVHGLTANQKVSIFANAVSPGSFQCFVQEAAGHAIFPGPGLILNASERLLATGTGLTAGAAVAVAIQAIELPIQLAWQLL